MGVIPEHYHPFVDMSDFDQLHMAMRGGRAQIAEEVATLPSHAEFLRTHCPAEKLPVN